MPISKMKCCIGDVVFLARFRRSFSGKLHQWDKPYLKTSAAAERRGYREA
jgi:hypothetical protein